MCQLMLSFTILREVKCFSLKSVSLHLELHEIFLADFIFTFLVLSFDWFSADPFLRDHLSILSFFVSLVMMVITADT